MKGLLIFLKPLCFWHVGPLGSLNPFLKAAPEAQGVFGWSRVWLQLLWLIPFLSPGA